MTITTSYPLVTEECGEGITSIRKKEEKRNLPALCLSSLQRTDAEAEAPILWPPDGKSRLTGKDADAGQEKGMTEDEMAGWHHQLNKHEFDQTPGDGEGQGSLGCCSSWGHKESDTN